MNTNAKTKKIILFKYYLFSIKKFSSACFYYILNASRRVKLTNLKVKENLIKKECLTD